MFDDLLRETAFNYNLRKCKKPKKLLKKVKKGLGTKVASPHWH